MRAVVFDAIGDRGRLADVPEPHLDAGDVLIRVAAVGLVASDWRMRGGSRFPRQQHRFPAILGLDFAGEIAESADPRFVMGERVFGIANRPFVGAGCLADYVAMPVDGPLAPTPSVFDDVTAASLVSGWLTAQATIGLLEPLPGGTVVLLGASGGVGSVLTQLLVRTGWNVVGVARAVNADYVRSLGAVDVIAHDVVDTPTELARRWPAGVDAIIDLVNGRDGFAALVACVAPGGQAISGVAAADVEALDAGGRRGGNVATRPDAGVLADLGRNWLEGGYRLPHTEVLRFDEALDGIDRLEQGRIRGKLVVRLDG